MALRLVLNSHAFFGQDGQVVWCGVFPAVWARCGLGVLTDPGGWALGPTELAVHAGLICHLLECFVLLICFLTSFALFLPFGLRCSFFLFLH